MKSNKVFIATSIDGFIAGQNGELDWLHAIPNPDQNDMGYAEFMSEIDAIIMGRNTFETVCGFEDWPYDKPVFVLSNHMNKIPDNFKNKAQLVNGDLHLLVSRIHKLGYHKLYIDGGRTINSFLKQDLVDEMTNTIIPVLLGGGTPLFSNLKDKLHFKCVETKIYLGQVVQNHFERSQNES